LAPAGFPLIEAWNAQHDNEAPPAPHKTAERVIEDMRCDAKASSRA
jgi:hypothetical protein